MSTSSPWIPAEREALLSEMFVQTDGSPCPGSGEIGQAFAEDAAPTPGDATPEATCLYMQRDDAAAASHVGERALVVTLNATGTPTTLWTARSSSRRPDHQV
jgi:hypothetical protein